MHSQGSDSGSALYTALISLVAALGGLLFGFDWAVISGTVPFLETHFDLDSYELGVAVSSALFGCIIGVCFAGTLSDRFGRKRPLIGAAILFVVSALLTALATNLSLFIAARLLGGIAIGLSSPISPIYIAEMAPEKRRGALVTLYQFAITFGIVAAYACDWLIAGMGDDAWGASHGWRWMFVSEVPPALLFLAALFFVPESPRWLAKEGLEDDAREILSRIGGSEHAEYELGNIRAALEQEAGSVTQLFQPGLRKALWIGIGIMIFSQITGNFAVFTFTPKLLLQAGFKSSSSALLGMVAIGIVNMLTTIIAILVIDRLGRRPLLMLAPIGMSICMALIAIGLTMASASPIALLGLILGFVFFYAVGVGPGAWLIISEIFPTRLRGRAMSICTLCLWVVNFLTTLVFPSLWESTQAGTFWLFAFTSASLAIFVWAMLPETKGRSLEEIESFWSP
ncbi:Arabinose-proton symporter [Planctomycetes bacterium CA13]|uniref:Arabinose-proton symporter n=1 Tax=Novipirellula herctigrandis TaxID=2527986 RepID=A0A5C5ZA97_9BACT|nr:Arabinose-proton symporter [Planctomycetes bacterium CA13]